MLSLTLISLNAWGDDLPRPDFKCLTRAEKEQIEIAFEQNDQCHKSLENVKAIVADEIDWTYLTGALILGILGGMVIQAQLHR
jgi:hypothetical protein